MKGKSKPTTVYELIGRADDPEAQKRIADLSNFEKGIELYKQRCFDEALTCFSKCVENLPNDVPAKVYIERSKQYIVNPPDKDWSGVFTMKTK